jgi:UDP-N-acetylmuramoyl-tripeptide--D-alanyl-D-alanine ligase
MTNTASFTATDLRSLFGDRAFVPDYLASVGVSTDSRTIAPGNIFVALGGERYDGHTAIGEAIRKGAVCMVFEERWLEQWNQELGVLYPLFPRVIVPSTLKALAELATYHRRRFSIPVVAVAGSAGKTSTKELIAHVLSSRYTTHRTQANFNNQIGTPHTLLQLTKKHTALVIEIGTNEPGEIAVLTSMTEPTHGIITNIGKEHLEKLIDLDGVEREETALFEWMKTRNHATPKPIALINNDDERLRRYQQNNSLPSPYTFGENANSDVRATVEFDDELHPSVTIHYGSETFTAQMQTTGFASAYNAIAASATAYSLGLQTNEIHTALESYQQPTPHGYARMVVERMGNITVLNDCYNANPESMVMALRTLTAYKTQGQRIALLGDMRELGSASPDEHHTLLKYAMTDVDVVLIIGDEFHSAYNRLREYGSDVSNVVPCGNHQSAFTTLIDIVKQGDVVLVKGSRGIALEKVIERWKLHTT